MLDPRRLLDGADVMHLLYACADRLDWKRPLAREQYLTDVGAEGFDEARLIVNSTTLEEIAHWTRAISEGSL